MKKVLGLLACICLAAALTTAAFADTHTSHNHTGWTALNADNLKNGYSVGQNGNYYFSENISNTTGNFTISRNKNVTLCLNGKTLDMGSATNIIVNSGATLTICDCQGNGSISGSLSSGNSGIIDVKGGTLYLEGGTVTGSNTHAIYNGQNNSTGTVYITGGTIQTTANGKSAINNNGGDVTVSGGEVTGKRINFSIITYPGYGITSSGGTVNITSGTVEGETGVKTDTNAATITITGGNIYGKETAIVTQKDDVLTIGGATVTGGTYAIDNNGSLYLYGSPAITGGTNKAAIKASGGNIFAYDNGDSTQVYTGGEVTVEVANAAENMVVIHGVNNDNEGRFTVTNTGFALNRSENDLALISHSGHDFTSNIYRQVGNNQHRQKCTGCNQYGKAVACTRSSNVNCAQVTTCVCGREMPAVAHTYNDTDDTVCILCGARKEVSGGNPPSTGGSGGTGNTGGSGGSGGDTVDSAQTSDAGAAVYAGMALASAAGAVYAGKKRK